MNKERKKEMEKECFNFVLPTWEEIKEKSTEEFISYRFKKVLEGNLYVCSISKKLHQY